MNRSRHRIAVPPPSGIEVGLALAGRGKEAWPIPVAGGELQKPGLTMNGLRGLRVHPDERQIAFAAGWTEKEVWVLENLLPAAQTAKAPAPRR